MSLRALRIVASSSMLIAILACGRGTDAPPPVVADPVVQPAQPAGPPALPDDIMPLTEGGEVQARDPGTASVIAHFPNGQFDTLRARVTDWMPAHGWTLVPGS